MISVKKVQEMIRFDYRTGDRTLKMRKLIWALVLVAVIGAVALSLFSTSFVSLTCPEDAKAELNNLFLDTFDCTIKDPNGLSLSKVKRDIEKHRSHLTEENPEFAFLGNTQIYRYHEYDSAIGYLESKKEKINLPSVYHYLGNYEFFNRNYHSALKNYKSAMKLYENDKDSLRAAIATGNMGIAYCAKGKAKKAVKYHKKAFAILDKLDPHPIKMFDEGIAMGEYKKYCWKYSMLGHDTAAMYDSQIDYYERRLAKADDKRKDKMALYLKKLDRTRIHHHKGVQLANLGVAHYALNQFEKSLEYFNKASSISMCTYDKHAEGDRLRNIGIIHLRSGRAEKAIDFFKASEQCFGSIGDKLCVGELRLDIGRACHALGRMDEAINHHLEARRILEKRMGTKRRVEILIRLGLFYIESSQEAKARDHFQQAFDLLNKLRPQVKPPYVEQVGIVLSGISKGGR